MNNMILFLVTIISMSSCFDKRNEPKSRPLAIVSKQGPSHSWKESNSKREFTKTLTQVSIDNVVIGTGFFISSRVAITNAHVALMLKYCFESGSLKCQRFTLNNPTWGELLISADDIQTFNDLDLGVVTIKENSPLEGHEFTFSVEYDNDLSHPLTLFSFSDSKIIEVGCEIQGSDLDRKFRPSFFHGCDTVPSFSGSPIISRKSNKIIGLHWGASKSNNYNQAIPMSLIEERLQSVLY